VVDSSTIGDYIKGMEVCVHLTRPPAGAVFAGIGVYASEVGFSSALGTVGGELPTTQVLTHAVAGGTLSDLQGGKFATGFISAGISKSVGGNLWEGDTSQDVLGRTMIVAATGGLTTKISGGKFANGFLTSGLAHLLNHEVSKSSYDQDGRTGADITPEQKALLKQGDYVGFWWSRLDSGDPVAHVALAGWDTENYAADPRSSLWYRLAAPISWVNLKAHLAVYYSGDIDVALPKIGIALAEAHADYVRQDHRGINHLLSPDEVAKYHHEVFKKFDLGPGAFGGTIFGNDADLYRRGWCIGCDYPVEVNILPTYQDIKMGL